MRFVGFEVPAWMFDRTRRVRGCAVDAHSRLGGAQPACSAFAKGTGSLSQPEASVPLSQRTNTILVPITLLRPPHSSAIRTNGTDKTHLNSLMLMAQTGK